MGNSPSLTILLYEMIGGELSELASFILAVDLEADSQYKSLAIRVCWAHRGARQTHYLVKGQAVTN